MANRQAGTATIPDDSAGMSLLSPGMLAVLLAQFLSALADNVILIVAIALFKFHGQFNRVPLLQESFLVPFILLAPFVGRIADRFPKKWVMLGGSVVKLIGAAAMNAGIDPLAMYGAIGIGAAVYSPAKYGILVQMFGPAKLVRANGMIEGSTIVAILLGVVLGGWLSDRSLAWAFASVLVFYGLATVLSLFIPNLPAEKAGAQFHPWQMLKEFAAGVTSLFRDADARFSLIGTSIFWGSGSTLRLMLFAWVPAALLITDNKTPANLMGVLSIGIVIGALLAGAWVTLDKVNRALIGGILLGPATIALAYVHALPAAALCMAVIGAGGGFFVVPLNALLQERGHLSIGSGNALAVQNFVENSAMMLFVAGYGLTVSVMPVTTAASAFGVMLLAAMVLLALVRQRKRVA